VRLFQGSVCLGKQNEIGFIIPWIKPKGIYWLDILLTNRSANTSSGSKLMPLKSANLSRMPWQGRYFNLKTAYSGKEKARLILIKLSNPNKCSGSLNRCPTFERQLSALKTFDDAFFEFGIIRQALQQYPQFSHPVIWNVFPKGTTYKVGMRALHHILKHFMRK